MYKRIINTLAFIFILNIITIPVFAEENIWQPEKTWVFVVGVLEWKNNSYSGYTKKGRKDELLVNVLKSRGVPVEQIVYLQDKKATQKNIDKSLKELLAKTSESDFLILYYCGHGGPDEKGNIHFVPYDMDKKSKGWTVSSIIKDIDSGFKGSFALLTADCCYSGAMATEIKGKKPMKSFAVLTSVSDNETSTDNWTFTNTLIDGFNGNPAEDLNKDGKITLKEMGEYAKADMSIFEGQIATFFTYGSIDEGIKISDAKGKIIPPIGNRVEVLTGGQWWPGKITDIKGDKVKIRWLQIGYDNPEDDEWFKKSDIREIKIEEYSIGTKVEVDWNGQWYKAKIIDIKDGIYLIHYEDYENSYNEWVSPKRIRLLKK